MNGAINQAYNPRHHDPSKHIDTKHRAIHKAVSNKLIKVLRVDSNENTADILPSQSRAHYTKSCHEYGTMTENLGNKGPYSFSLVSQIGP